MVYSALSACCDYSKFSFAPSNRDVQDAHVAMLTEAMQEVYLFDLYPIVTTANLELADGQHRFTGCQNLGVPFYFIAGDGITTDDVSRANDNTERYTVSDALQVFSSIGLEPYRVMAEFLENHPVLANQPAYTAIKLSSDYQSESFLAGDFFVDRLRYAGEVARVLAGFTSVVNFVNKSPAYRRAIPALVCNRHYKHDQMMAKLRKKPTRLRSCGKYTEALAEIDLLYNDGNRAHNRVDLTSLDHTLHFEEELPTLNTSRPPSRTVADVGDVLLMRETDLTKFTSHPSSRTPRNLDKLTAAIQEKNLLQFYPIVVDENMVVYDGQRRLSVARELGLPIFYIVGKNITMWMIAQAGGIAKAWSLKDYAKHYATLGYPAYIRMIDLVKRYRFLGYESFMAMHNGGRIVTRAQFKAGRYEFVEDVFGPLLEAFTQIKSSAIRKPAVQQIIMGLYVAHPTPAFLRRLIAVLNADSEGRLIPDRRHAEYKAEIIAMYNHGLSVNRIEEAKVKSW